MLTRCAAPLIGVRFGKTFVELFGDSISATNAFGGDVTIDIAIEPDDCSGAPTVFSLPPERVSALASLGVSLELSIYRV